MFVLRTGLQGNGKSLNTIKEVDLKAAREGRKVYYCNITGFDPGHPILKAEWIPFEDPTKWFELPPNAIAVIDEAQQWFRVRPQGSRVPEYASRLEIMRKDGHEVHAITQSPKLIDSHMRELCNMHIHYHRGFGGKVIKRWQFQKPELTVNSNKLNFENGEATRITIDKDYFGTYQSIKEGAEHHMKFRAPKALYVLGTCVLIGAVLIYRLVDSLGEKMEGAQPVVEASEPESLPLQIPGLTSPGVGLHLSTEDYIAARTPRIAGVPSSAPIYDELTKPQSFPKPSCYATRSEIIISKRSSRLKVGSRNGRMTGCACLSQQGSRMDVPFEACMDMVENGYFDDTKPDPMPSAVGGLDAPRAAGTPTAAQAQAQPAAVNKPRSTSLFIVQEGVKPADAW